MKEIMLSVLTEEQSDFERIKEILGFKVLHRTEKIVDKHGLPQPKGFGQTINEYQVLISDYQYAVFHGTAKRIDMTEGKNEFENSMRAYHAEDKIDFRNLFRHTDVHFRQKGLAGWLLTMLILSMENNNYILERLAALRGAERKGVDPQDVINIGMFLLKFE